MLNSEKQPGAFWAEWVNPFQNPRKLVLGQIGASIMGKNSLLGVLAFNSIP
jgi:hypothetical protein